MTSGRGAVTSQPLPLQPVHVVDDPFPSLGLYVLVRISQQPFPEASDGLHAGLDPDRGVLGADVGEGVAEVRVHVPATDVDVVVACALVNDGGHS